MRDLVFFLRRHLSIGFPQLGHKKHRVIAKAVISLGGVGNRAGALAPSGEHISVGKGTADGADKFSPAVQLAPQTREHQLIAVHIVQPLPAVAGGEHPRRAAQGVHAKAGVVGNGGQTGGLHHGDRLQRRVFLKGLSGLLHLQIDAHVAFQDHLYAQVT